MTERDKKNLIENARFYHAAHKPPRKQANGGKGIFAAAAAIILFTAAEPDKDFLIKTVSAVSATSAKLSLMHFEPSAPPTVNEPEESVNTIITEPVSSEDDLLMVSRGINRMPSSENEEAIVDDLLPMPSADNNELPFPEEISRIGGKITSLTYTAGSGDNYISLKLGGQIRNVTDISSEKIMENAAIAPDFTIKLNAEEDCPQVLIMHTHTTESFEPSERDFYDMDYLSRTTDNSMNITAVGRKMTEIFEKNGIRTLHDETVHDYPSYNGSYDRSRETVTAILEKYPSIKVILDVHRDAIERENGDRIAPCTEINGKSAAQVMLICGCDDGTMGMPDYMKNLRTAALFQQYMEKSYPTLTRPVLFDYRHYNQDLTTGSLLIEVGGHANSLGQAVYAGELAAEGISQALISIAKED